MTAFGFDALSSSCVIPAKAGIFSAVCPVPFRNQVPAFAGTTRRVKGGRVARRGAP